ncbi:MAG: DUF2281 domain-containing protein [Leptolyngbyaceae cyanobacterium SM2_5_2]|nr:DUF2281 domain-containing protein [Leptolyngbyaceae cyanobacterium SM2_5_2]
MTTKDLIWQELEQAPADLLDKVLVFLRFLKSVQAQDGLETALLSESALQKDWLLPEEEEAWQDL